jgi:hypothetical protein
MHEVTERLERLLTLFLLLMLGIALSRGLLDDLDWRSVAVGLGLIIVIRPGDRLPLLPRLCHRRGARARVGLDVVDGRLHGDGLGDHPRSSCHASDVSRRRTGLRVVKHTLDVVTRVTLLFRIA